jgi:hypothetical protein
VFATVFKSLFINTMSCACRIALWAAVTWWVCAPHVATAQDQTQSRFEQTVHYLQTASPELRGDFAAIALTNLTAAYAAEAQLARAQASTSGHSANLRSWSAMVDYYARQLPLLLSDIELGLPVQLIIGAEQELAVVVADRTVIVSPPRLNQQSAFEQGILADFCTAHSCAALSPGDETLSPANAAPEPAPAAMVAVRPEWTFSMQGPVCSYAGIQVRFDNDKNLANSRLICQQFLREVMTLADELAWQQRHGVVIDWGSLNIQAVSHRPEHLVAVNGMGDSVLVTVPLLYRNPDLLQQILPWMRGRLGNQPDISVELKADQYGWQKP